jgi:hypothetical protein
VLPGLRLAGLLPVLPGLRAVLLLPWLLPVLLPWLRLARLLPLRLARLGMNGRLPLLPGLLPRLPGLLLAGRLPRFSGLLAGRLAPGRFLLIAHARLRAGIIASNPDRPDRHNRE